MYLVVSFLIASIPAPVKNFVQNQHSWMTQFKISTSHLPAFSIHSHIPSKAVNKIKKETLVRLWQVSLTCFVFANLFFWTFLLHSFSPAFLPSSFCMYTTLVAMTGWFQDSTPLAVLGVAAGVIVGWPFSALIGWGRQLKRPFVVYATMPNKHPIEWLLMPLWLVSFEGFRSRLTCWC